ncbi:MAG: DivIVA domain-containing protein [Myxococcota bacterium]
MIKFSADDIANQTFETSFRGYDRQQVEEFLNVLGREWEHVVSELRQSREQLEEQRKELQDYRRREKSLHDALNMAKEMADEVKHQAEREAELTIADAEVKAEKMLAGVENRVSNLRQELFDLQQQRVRCETQMRNVLESHIKMLDLMSEPEAEPKSAISRSPEGAPRPPSAPREGEPIEVADDDIESAEDAVDEPAHETSTGMHTSQ